MSTVKVAAGRLLSLVERAIDGWEDCGGCPMEGRCREDKSCVESLYLYLKVEDGD